LENLLRSTSWRVSNIDYGAQVTFELPLGAAEIDPFRTWLSETTSGRCEAVEIGMELVEVPV
jgi:putative IMPACT (imprinted ancient) family translation regulator